MSAVGTAAPHRPYLPGPFRWRLGLRPLDPVDWFELHLPDVAAQMEHVQRVLHTNHSTVVAVEPDIEAEAAEVHRAVLDHLATHHPEHLARWGRGDDGVHPLEAAARLVPEDLALLVPRAGGLVFGGGVICSPNRWDLRSKLGRTMRAVHEPVPQLNEQLAEPIDRFFERLTPERGYWRLGWGVLDTAELYQPLDGTAPPRSGRADPDAVGLGEVHLRVERETLRRFPETGAVLFTIRTHITPLRAIMDEPSQAALLAEAIAALPDDVAGYKELGAFGQRVLAWLVNGEDEGER